MTQANHEQLFQKAMSLLARAAFDVRPVLYAAGEGEESGNAITAEQRNEMLQRLARGEFVAVDIDLLAYEQRPGVANRNFVRFRDLSLIKLGESGKGKPFLRDHMQWSTLAVAGRVLTSKTTKLGDGHYEIRQRARLTADWAVKLALQDLLGAASIGWEPTGPIECSACKADIRRDGWACHYPGDSVSEVTQADGTKKYMRDRKGALRVEWIYTDASLLETSLVPIGGVKLAGIEGVKAALAASGQLSDEDSRALAALAEYSTPTAPVAHVQGSSTEPIMSEPVKPGIVILSTEQHAHYLKLPTSDQEKFLAKTAAERDAELAAALAADPVLYTAKDGTAIRKSDGAVALMFAKQADAAADREQLAAQREQQATAAQKASELAARAKTTLAGMHGSDEVHVAILGAVESITDEKLRASALQSLNAWRNGGIEKLAPGVNPQEPAPSSLQAQFDAGVAKLATEQKLDLRKARLAYVKTDEGRALYNRIEQERKASA